MYYVVYGRKAIILMILLLAMGATLWVGFGSGWKGVPEKLSPENMSISDGAELTSEPTVQALAGGVQRSVSELDQNVIVSVKSIPTKFAEYRIEREKARSRRLELLENNLDNSELSQKYREELQDELLNLLGNAANETEIENLLKANGYLDAVTLIENQSATVVVPVTLTKEEAVIIGDLVHRITGIQLERITIVDEMTKA